MYHFYKKNISYVISMHMKQEKIHFGQKLSEVRKQKNLSQRDLAKLTGISQRMIAHYETRASNIPLDKLIIIIKTLGISLDELMELKKLREIKPVEKPSRLMNKLIKVENLPKSAQKTILKTINAFLKANV